MILMYNKEPQLGPKEITITASSAKHIYPKEEGLDLRSILHWEQRLKIIWAGCLWHLFMYNLIKMGFLLQIKTRV